MPEALFDLDGVLADSRGPITSCVRETLAARGHAEPAEEALLAFIGPPARDGFALLTGAPPDEVEACVSDYRARYARALWDTPAIPGVGDAVRELVADGWRLGVATSKVVDRARDVLEAIGLADAFAVVCGPAPESHDGKAETVAEALRVLPGAVALVGDRRFDVEAARAHGLRPIGVTWGFGSRAELERAGADLLLDDPAQLAAALRASRSSSTWTTGP